MARIERGAGISEPCQSQALLHAVGGQFVPLETASLICALILRPDQRSFLKDQHRFACLGHFVCNRCSTSSASDNNNIKIRFHDCSYSPDRRHRQQAVFRRPPDTEKATTHAADPSIAPPDRPIRNRPSYRRTWDG